MPAELIITLYLLVGAVYTFLQMLYTKYLKIQDPDKTLIYAQIITWPVMLIFTASIFSSNRQVWWYSND